MTKTLIAICLVCANLQVDVPAAEFQFDSKQRGAAFFAGREAEVGLQLTSPRDRTVTVTWRLSAEHRTLQVGETNEKLKADVVSNVDITLRTPPLHQDVVQTVCFNASAKDPAGNSLGEFDTEFTLFPADPFSNRREWLTELNLCVYDPNGATSKVLGNTNVPFKNLSSLSRLPPEKTVVVIAEGISLHNKQRLSERLLEIADAGNKVLWFAPADGNAVFPNNSPKQLSFARSNYIEHLDKRLDANAWSTEGIVIRPESIGKDVRLQIDNINESGFRCMHVEYDSEGQLILSGFPIASCWDASPNPRYLLLKLLEL